MPDTRIFFTSDVHGSDVCFKKFLNSAKVYQADILVLGGDLTGKMIVSIVEQPDGTFIADFLGTEQILKTPEERTALEKDIRNSGYYPYLTTPAEAEKLKADKKLRDELFSKVMLDDVRRWVNLAEERLKGTKVKCYISPGNDDRFDIDEALTGSSTVINPEQEVVWIDDHHEMITTGYVNVTPWKAPRDIPDEELQKKIQDMTGRVQNMDGCIFNFHCPPYNTQIDIAPELDATLRPVVEGGGAVRMIHVGSAAVRTAIEKHQPLLSLHGHIHESRGFVKIGRTLCINPGSEYGEGILRGVLLNLDEKRVKNYILTQG
ncbi:MAG: metallophosphoesterase [Candidatus Bathyarchaeia archaeon]